MKKFILAILITIIAINTNDSYAKSKNNKEVEETTNTANMISTMLKVQVSGAVKKPGVYQVPIGSRVADAISKAGGLRKDAFVKDLNLTTTVTDSTKIHIVSKSEIEQEKKEEQKLLTNNNSNSNDKSNKNIVSYNKKAKSKSNTKNSNGIFNINTASQEDLDSLPGIGKKIAQSIIQYRNKNKGFKSLDELTNIDGIGEKKLKKLKARLKV
ncbi:MAG: helix-hairpin-helix domain-containing protein [Candidatus Sericytochromatia bacterium]